MKVSSVPLCLLVAVLTNFWTAQSARAESLLAAEYYTWGIDSNDLSIPEGSIITEAVLKVHDVTRAGNSQNGLLHIHLLDNIPSGFVANDNQTPADIFAGRGPLLTPVYRGTPQVTEDLVYTFGQIDDPSSSIWEIFQSPFVFQLVDSTVTYSSTLLNLIDYAGAGTSFGIGIDPNGMDDYTFDGISLEIAIAAYEGAAETSVLTFEYGSTNDPPVLAQIADKSVAESNLLSFGIAATDPDGDAITYSALNLPGGAQFGAQSFTWTPDYTQAGTYQVTFIADDGKLQDSRIVSITVDNTNREPVLAVIGSKSVQENSVLTFTVNATDLDGEPLTYLAQNLPEGADFTNRTFTWIPTYSQAGNYTVTFVAGDGDLEDTETVVITVENLNRPPVFVYITDKSVAENSELAFTVIAFDPDGDPVICLAHNLPAGADFTDRTFTWTPAYSQAGTYQVTFTANDGQSADLETVAITVTNLNRGPVLQTIADKSVAENDQLLFSIAATDPDGDTLTYAAENLPDGAVFSGQTFTWTPGNDQAGIYQVTFTASDQDVQDSMAVTITVTDSNRSPVIEPVGDKSVNERKMLTFTLGATDPDGDTIAYSAADMPNGAALDGDTFTWRPRYGQFGTYQVTFIASDGNLQDSEQITITVNQVKLAGWYDKWLKHLGK